MQARLELCSYHMVAVVTADRLLAMDVEVSPQPRNRHILGCPRGFGPGTGPTWLVDVWLFLFL